MVADWYTINGIGALTSSSRVAFAAGQAVGPLFFVEFSERFGYSAPYPGVLLIQAVVVAVYWATGLDLFSDPHSQSVRQMH